MLTEWQPVKFNSDSIRGLIRTRLEFDKVLSNLTYGSKDKKVKKLVDIYKEGNDYIENYDEIIVCVYADLDRLVDNTNLTKTQRDVLAMYGLGWTVAEISEMRETSVQNINQIINRACGNIEDTNDKYWKKWVHRNKTNKGLFICSLCGTTFPKTEEYKSDGEDICIDCEIEISNEF